MHLIDHKVVFIHVPKAAGTSIRQAFGLGTFIDKGSHWTAKQTFARYPFARDLFSFAFVRNPWDRMVAFYFYAHPEGFDERTWERFIEQDCPDQYEYVCDQGQQLVTFVGRYETLESDFRTVCHRLGKQACLPHRHKTDHEHYRLYYNADTQRRVARHYERDIAQFEYRF